MTKLRRSNKLAAALATSLMLGIIAPAKAQDTSVLDVEPYVRASANLLEGIEALDESERAAVGALLVIDRAILNYEMLGVRADQKPLVRYHGRLEAFSPVYPEIGRPLMTEACLDSHVSYLRALMRCEDEDPSRSEEECHEAWEPGGEALICMMTAMEDLRGKLLRFSDRFPVPPPFENRLR